MGSSTTADAPFYGSSTDQGFGTIVDMATDGAPTAQAQEGFPAIRHNDLQNLGERLAQARRFAGPKGLTAPQPAALP